MQHDHGSIQESASQPIFHKVAENLYRLDSSGGYYALVKKSGKQFRRSLKTTKDRKFAARQLKEIKEKSAIFLLPRTRNCPRRSNLALIFGETQR